MLSTNFKDDIVSGGAKRKYKMTNNSDGTVSFEDVTNYSQEGSSYGAKEVNEERMQINLLSTDYVVEENFSDPSSMYRKWNSGLLEVWTSSLYTMPVNLAWGSCYRSDTASGKQYPVSFVDVPEVVATVKTDVNDACWMVQRQGERTNQAPDYYFVRPDQIGFSAKFYVSTYSIGRWK